MDHETATITQVDARDIIAGNNDRTRFDAEGLRALAASIARDGLLQPITVRFCDEADAYVIVAGERRYRAILSLGWEAVPAIIRDLTDEEAAAAMLQENTSRADLDPIDEANAYAGRMRDYGWTVEQVAERAGVTTTRVIFRLKLLRLRADMLDLVRTGTLQIGYAQILADAGLDANRQLIALRHLTDNAAPTPSWFRTVTSGLAEDQAQDGLFDLMQVAQVMPAKRAPRPQDPPVPTKVNAPAGTLAEQATFWAEAAAAWDTMGKNFKRDECLAASAALANAGRSA